MAIIDDSKVAAARLTEALLSCRKAVVFTGAGISTESGIPDFRSPGGMWSKMQPIQFQDFLTSDAARREDWRRRFMMFDQFRDAKPNAGHRAIARWVEAGIADIVITQNIDGLHQLSGVPAEAVVELHGNGTYAACLDCEKRFDEAALRATFDRDGRPPVCDACGGIVKAAVISFGQMMPEREMERAQEATLAADLFIAIGSSLVVFPAAGFPLLAKRNGAQLLLVNGTETDLDFEADLVLRGKIGDILGKTLLETS